VIKEAAGVPQKLAEKLIVLNGKEIAMKKIGLAVLAVFLTLSGVTLAQHSGDQKKGSSMMESMPDMMKSKRSGGAGMPEVGDMGGRMGMMKMIEQCNEMMKSGGHQDEKAKETE
jgi:hypothetical protein